ncbi:hypothetical protein QFC22_006027 [Naganishia vaughanmartiniae]|uniref:Uncharacterized protein n=1 Tax=Naganishia vaughanmartiniae TaxID=1424756 RepID=A0ACC2WNZ1_9TREE|nr:hypothetical protein QFC22_006027 [Naganishia vaughanmartiniae]
MLSLSLAALTSVLVALGTPANAAPIREQHDLLKRTTGALITSTIAPDFCIGVEELKEGAALVTKNCMVLETSGDSSTPAFYYKWDIAPGNNQVVRLSGLPAGSGDFCLDAGDLSGDMRSGKIWTCYPGLPQQHGSGTQTWNIVEGSGGGTTPPPPPPPPPSPPATTGKPIKWAQEDKELCLTVGNGAFSNGATLTINSCFEPSSDYYAFQQFVYNEGNTKIQVAPNNLTTTDYCVDFGSDRGVNGVGAKIWQCYPDLPAQNLWITGDAHISVTGDNQCMDVRAESAPGQNKPYGSLKDIQSWQCSGGNSNQIFKF